MNRFEAVRKFARRIADRFDLTPPIDVSNIFSEMDIQIVEEENQYGIEAYSQLNDNKYGNNIYTKAKIYIGT